MGIPEEPLSQNMEKRECVRECVLCVVVTGSVCPRRPVNPNGDTWQGDVEESAENEMVFESLAMVHTTFKIILWFLYLVDTY